MKKSLIVGLPMAVLGPLLTAIPLWLLPVCAVHHGAAPMRCHWSGMVLAGFGGMVFALAILLFLFRSADARAGLSAAAIVAAVTAGLAPTTLVGMCANDMMPCRTGTYPAVMIVLALIALAGVVNIIHLKYANRLEARGNETAHDLAYRLEQS